MNLNLIFLSISSSHLPSSSRYMAIMNPLKPRMGKKLTLCIALSIWVSANKPFALGGVFLNFLGNPIKMKEIKWMKDFKKNYKHKMDNQELRKKILRHFLSGIETFYHLNIPFFYYRLLVWLFHLQISSTLKLMMFHRKTERCAIRSGLMRIRIHIKV